MDFVPVPHRLRLPETQLGCPYTIDPQYPTSVIDHAEALVSHEMEAYAGFPDLQRDILLTAIDDVTFAGEVEEAAARIAGVIKSTGVYDYNGLTIKDETQQQTRAYKERGAANFIIKAAEHGDVFRVVTASAGNHGQAVAMVASQMGIPATVVVPLNTPTVKINAIKARGGQVVVDGEDYSAASLRALEINAAHRGLYVPAFDHRDIMAGQGTIGRELATQVPNMTDMVVPTGGGGLLAGIAKYLAVRRPGVAVYGSGIHGASAAEAAFARGNSELSSINRLADGIAVRQLGAVTWPEIKRHARGVLTADEAAVRRTIGVLSLQGHILEGAGAVGIAAALANQARFGATTVVVATGGNIDSELLMACQRLAEKSDATLTERPAFAMV